MANNSFSYTSYGRVQTYDKINGGWLLYGNGNANPDYRNDPVVGTRVFAVSPGQVMTTAFGSVTINSIVEVFPSGLTVPNNIQRYACSDLFSALVTART